MPEVPAMTIEANSVAISATLHRHLTGQCLKEGDCRYCEDDQ